MTIKVGDKVRIVANECGSVNEIGDVGIVAKLVDNGCQVEVEGNPTACNWQLMSDLELVYDTTATITDQCIAKMEAHMDKGEFVRAVKWAQAAEFIKELEADQ